MVSAHGISLKDETWGVVYISYTLKSRSPLTKPHSFKKLSLQHTKTSSTICSNADSTSEKKSCVFVDTFQPVISAESPASASEFAVCVVAVPRLQLDFPGARRTRHAFLQLSPRSRKATYVEGGPADCQPARPQPSRSTADVWISF